MNRVMRMDLVAVLVFAVATLQMAYAAEYTVGDSTGWIAPSVPTFYSDWSASQTFKVGDTLKFEFTTGSHTVAVVTKESYDACDLSTTTSIETTGPATITLTTVGMHYYFCTIPGHCTRGQKLAVNVVDNSNPSPSPSSDTPPPSDIPSPSSDTPPAADTPPAKSSPPPPPKSSSAHSLHSATVLAAVFVPFVAAAFLV